MKRAVIACKVLTEELQLLLPPGVEMRVLEQELHRTPEKLRETVQREIDSVDADEIMLGYGLCGNGVAGLQSERARLVLPRVDDCISILLGSLERYQEQVELEPGTYWLSRGWIEHANNTYKSYRDEWVGKYGEETARWIAHEMLKGYRRLTLVDTHTCPISQLQGYAHEHANFFGLRYEEMEGSDALLRGLLELERPSDQFVTVEPGEPITAEMFMPPVGNVNG